MTADMCDTCGHAVTRVYPSGMYSWDRTPGVAVAAGPCPPSGYVHVAPARTRAVRMIYRDAIRERRPVYARRNIYADVVGGGGGPVGACPCECSRGGFCGGCGHAGCGGRR